MKSVEMTTSPAVSGISTRIIETLPPEYRLSVIREIYDLMSQRPHAIALTEGNLEWTYEDLRRQSNRVAKQLASHGIGRGSVVAMHLLRCADSIAVMLGIMVSGCIYLPLDPSYPPTRLRLMLDRANAVAVISHEDNPDLYGSKRAWLPSPSQMAAEPEAQANQLAAYSAQSEFFEAKDGAYILFTSGSTGEPKAVMVTHENITLMNQWSAKVLGVTSLDSSATTCSPSFDASFHETLLPLSVGGTVHVIPHALALGELKRQVSFIATTPTVAIELLRGGQLPPLRVLMLGGEALSPDIAERLLSSGRVRSLLNCYGPTECTVCVTMAEITAPLPEVIPIGRPVPGSEVLILDKKGQRLPDGELGEISVFGNQVTGGYVNDPTETAARFVIGPSTTAEPQRYYRTGDLGYRSDGLIYFAGRADRQVKINGIRIELGEIEAALRSDSQVAEAAAIAREGSRIVAYVVPVERRFDLDIAILKKHLENILPHFMRPAGIIVVDYLPKTVSGKLDVSSLPEWSVGRAGGHQITAEESDEITALLRRVVADVTGFRGPIHLSDDFINDLGGTSLGILKVLVELEHYTGRRLEFNDALADTSIAGLLSLLHTDVVGSPADFSFNTEGSATPLFLVHSYLGGMLDLRRLAELLPTNQPVYGLHVDCATDSVDETITIPSLAQNALNRIREVQPSGRIIISGHSAGALIVFEAARNILAAGDSEPRVLLMDSPWPHSSFEYYWGESLLQWRDMVRNPIGVLRAAAAKIFEAAAGKGNHLQVAARADDLMTFTDRRKKSVDEAVRSYRAQAYEGSITVMRTRQGRMMALGRRNLGWSHVTQGTLTMVDVPGGHVSMLRPPNVQTVAEKLIAWLSRDWS